MNSTATESDFVMNDLGPLAWVLDELRKSLEGSTKALKRFAWDAEMARGSDLAAIDASQLRIARQQLHQAVGALELVGLAGPAYVLRAMEAAVQKFVQQPELCSQDAVAKIEYASFALTEYLEGVLAEKPVSAVSLFPQYRDIQELVRADRIHPADLWPFEWRWLEPQLAVAPEARHYDAEARAILDQSVLQLMKGKAPQAARSLRDLSLGFSANQTDSHARIFWLIAAAYFEAIAHDLLGTDIYVRRAASRILLQYASLAKGDTSVSERLALDLLFFCAQAVSNRASDTPVLSAVRFAYGLTQFKPVDYELVQFGRFDPALLAQARKRIVLAKEAWSSLCAGEIAKGKVVADQFSLLTDSLRKLHAPSEPLAQALTRAIETALRTGQTPSVELAMEVATSVLYLEAVFEELDPTDPELVVRTTSLARRLESIRTGGEPQPLEGWMEELYRRVSNRQTMGSVVGELRVSLGELEKTLDSFFRNPQDKTTLQLVPGQLSQIRGVLSVLGLDHACRAVLHMKGSVEQMLDTEIDERLVRAAGTFEHLGNNLGALSFLVDMLNYQPALAKKLFVYDEEKDELKPVMGRSHSAGDAASSITVNNLLLPQKPVSVEQEKASISSDKLEMLVVDSAPAGQSVPAQSAPEAGVASDVNHSGATKPPAPLGQTPAAITRPALPELEDDDDLRDIFLEEAREVIGQAGQAVEALVTDPGEIESLTVLRRAFHTLKGSARMVGLDEFGEASWAMEQLLNSWLADQKTASKEFRTLCSSAIGGLEQWIAAIAANQDAPWSAAPFSESAEAMRIEGRYNALSLLDHADDTLAGSSVVEAAALDSKPLPQVLPQTDAVPDPVTGSDCKPDATPGEIAVLQPESAEPASADSGLDFDFDSLFAPADEPSHHLAPAAEPVEATELTAADFDEHFPLQATFTTAETAALSEAAAPESTRQDAQAEPESVDLDITESSEVSVGLPSDSANDGNADNDAIKVIGDLRIGIPLYNVYLNEADEWSRRLVNEVAEWALESHQPVSSSTVALAHSLAGSSATVGFVALSEMARSLEHALQNSRNHHSHGASAYGQLFVDASEDIRRLLHQFAAGFLKRPRPDILDRLNQLEFSDSVVPEVFEDDDFDFFANLALAGQKEEASLESAPLPQSDDQAVVTSEATPGSVDKAETTAEPTAPAITAAEPEDAAQTVVGIEPAADLLATRIGGPAIALIRLPDSLVSPVRAAPRVFHQDGQDDIDAVDAIDPDLFPIFEEECAELMPRLGGALRQWADWPDDQAARLEVLRVLHTLKGSARLAGALRLGEMAHRIESEISYVGSDAAASQEFEPLLNRFDGMQTTFEALRVSRSSNDTAATQALPAVAAASAAEASEPEQQRLLVPMPKAETSVSAGVHADGIDLGKAVVPGPQAMVRQPLRQAANASIRVRTQLLDRMVNQAGEVMITRSRMEAEISQLRISLNDMTGNLARLRQQLRDIELQAETQMQSRLALAKEAQAGFDPLEFDRFTSVQELTRMMAESVNDVAAVQRTLQRTIEATEDDLVAQGRQTRELQRDLLRTRMVEFESISERLYRVVRQASKETGKQVRLDLLGGTLEMDRGTLERMMPAFEHLLRNCVTHGIEAPQVRIDAGKEPVGLISIHLRQEGNDVSVEFSDDGSGLDLARIREHAIGQGLMAAEQPVDDQATASLIFLPGFSTAEKVTELAGRGIGLEVVRSDVLALGGRVETSTVAGKGTNFKLVLPLTTAVTQVVMIRAGSLSVGVPANVVETVRRASATELEQAYRTGTIDVAGEAVAFFWSGGLLQSSHGSAEAQAKTTPVVIFRSAAQRIALHVDEVLGNREVVVKNLGPQLSRLPGLTGMSVLPSGAVVLIYNPVALAAVYGEQARAWSQGKSDASGLASSGDGAVSTRPQPVAQLPLILVVDDSITVRRVTQRLLLRDGYRVAMAADGLQALERLQEEMPAVVISDIEMPRMDGFDLARNIRADERMQKLPIIMITSRIAEKHRKHARELGVNHYLGKPYPEEELMRLVRSYCPLEADIPA